MVKGRLYIFLGVLTFVFASCKVKQELPTGATPISQIHLKRVDKMPFHPQPYKYRDWRKTAVDFDNYIFDFKQKGQYLPFVWLDGMKRNYPDRLLVFIHRSEISEWAPIYRISQAMPFSRPVINNSFLPAHPQRLPPSANVVMKSTRLMPLTFHLAFSFWNMTQKWIKNL